MYRTNLILVAFVLMTLFCSCQENFDKSLQREAREFTEKQCPQEVEEGTRLDSLVYSPASHTLTHYYSVNHANERVLKDQTPLLHHILVQRTANDIVYKSVKDEDVTFKYVYYSQSKKTIVYETQVGPHEYK